jgi:hypothetical protein
VSRKQALSRRDRFFSVILGSQVRVRFNARRIAALADNPSCQRRAVLDVSGVDGVRLSAAAAVPAKFGQSAFAMIRGNMWEKSVLANDARVLSDLLAEHFGTPKQTLRVVDIGAPPDSEAADAATVELLPARAAATRRAIAALMDGSAPPSVVVHPVLALRMPGTMPTVNLEPDALALTTVDGHLVCAEIKSRPAVDGVVDPAAAASTARQVAVYVHALRLLLAEFGEDPARVSTGALLITPWNASNIAVVHPLNVDKRLNLLSRQLDRVSRVEDILDGLPDGFTLDPAAILRTVAADAPESVRVAAIAAEIRRIPANYLPACRSTCQMGEFCHHDAVRTGDPALLGADVRDHLAGIADLHRAAAIAVQNTAPADAALTDDEQVLLFAALVDRAARAAARGDQ